MVKSMIVKTAKMTAIAVIKEAGGWMIVQRSIAAEGGVIHDTPIEGPYVHESQAEKRASELAMANGVAAKEAKASGKKKAGEAMSNRGKQAASKAGMDAMVKFLTRNTGERE